MLVFLTLPWLSIKCEGEKVITVTGLDMVTLEEKVVSTPAGRDTLAPEVTDAILVYVAAVIAVAGAALLFVPMNRDHKRYTRAALGGLGVAALAGFVVQISIRVISQTEGLAGRVVGVRLLPERGGLPGSGRPSVRPDACADASVGRFHRDSAPRLIRQKSVMTDSEKEVSEQ